MSNNKKLHEISEMLKQTPTKCVLYREGGNDLSFLLNTVHGEVGWSYGRFSFNHLRPIPSHIRFSTEDDIALEWRLENWGCRGHEYTDEEFIGEFIEEYGQDDFDAGLYIEHAIDINQNIYDCSHPKLKCGSHITSISSIHFELNGTDSLPLKLLQTVSKEYDLPDLRFDYTMCDQWSGTFSIKHGEVCDINHQYELIHHEIVSSIIMNDCDFTKEILYEYYINKSLKEMVKEIYNWDFWYFGICHEQIPFDGYDRLDKLEDIILSATVPIILAAKKIYNFCREIVRKKRLRKIANTLQTIVLSNSMDSDKIQTIMNLFVQIDDEELSLDVLVNRCKFLPIFSQEYKNSEEEFELMR